MSNILVIIILLLTNACKIGETLNKREGENFYKISQKDSKFDRIYSNDKQNNQEKIINIILPKNSKKNNNEIIKDTVFLAFFEFKEKENIRLNFFDMDSDKFSEELQSFINSVRGNKGSNFIIYDYNAEIKDLLSFDKNNRIFVISEISPIDNNLISNNIKFLGSDPSEQIERLVNYGLNEGYISYYLLLPTSSSKSKIYEIMISRLLKKQNAHINSLEYYNSSDVNSLILSNRNLLKKMQNDENKKMFIFIDEIEQFPAINREWSNYKINNNEGNEIFAMIGRFPNNIIKEIKSNNNEIIISDLNFVTNSNFKNKFKNIFQYDLEGLASLTYDAISLLFNMPNDCNFSEFIENPDGFSGVNGIFKFSADQAIAKRKLPIIKLIEGEFVHIQ